MTNAREPAPTVAFIDDCCTHYQPVFANVRQCEQFTRLELGVVAETNRQSLPRLAQATKADPPALHPFGAKADWSVEAVHAMRLESTRQALRERPFVLCIDETGESKQGKTTAYAAHQYRGPVPTLANGVVSVTADGVLDTVTCPLAFRLSKPQRRLRARRRLHEQAAGGPGGDPGVGGAGGPLQRGAGRQPVRRELCLHAGLASAGRAGRGRHPLQPHRLDVSR